MSETPPPTAPKVSPQPPLQAEGRSAKQQGWKHHEWDCVAQPPEGHPIEEVAFCSLCGKYRLHFTDHSAPRVTKVRPELPEGSWL